MAFQRSHSKVWWDSDSQSSLFCRGHDFGPLNKHLKKTSAGRNISTTLGNLSKIQELEESRKSWISHESPGSLRSQDSGFSDNDDSAQGRKALNHKDTQSVSGTESPASAKTIETPPTVIRRKPDLIIPSSRRLSFSAPSSPILSGENIINQIDRISIVANTSFEKSNLIQEASPIASPCTCPNTKDKSIKRRRVMNRKSKRSLIELNSLTEQKIREDSSAPPISFQDYNNETVYFGVGEDDNNNLSQSLEKIKYSCFDEEKPPFPTSTSTPKGVEKIKQKQEEVSIADTDILRPKQLFRGMTFPYYSEYPNPLLNGHSMSVQYWLDDIRMSYNHEVMSTLQTKSIAHEAFRNLKITTATVAKIVRQLQTHSLILQGEFERVERSLRVDYSQGGDVNFSSAIMMATDLMISVTDFIKSLERKVSFFGESRSDRKKFDDNIEHMGLILRDLKLSLEKQHYLDADSVFEDVQVLKRYVLITLRLVFEQLIRVIMLNIENAKCDLVLRANLNMVATLSNLDFTGFASLNDAFLKNEAIRVLLLICLDSKFSSVRALSLRALATICSTPEAIRQFGETGGIEIVKDILVYDTKKTEPERREAVSLLTQVTAPWHGPQHSVTGLKDCVESIVESVTDILEKTTCCQTLLLCTACLNNLTKLEVTSIYSVMSNESVMKLREAIENRGPSVSIFLYEQIAGLLYNMSGNKKCHSHLANKSIIEFVTAIFQTKFYEKYTSRAESDAHHRTIKTILHVFSRLIHESVVGQEILENNFIPIFSRVEKTLNSENEHSKDISYISKQLNESLTHYHHHHSQHFLQQKPFNRSSEARSSNSSQRSLEYRLHSSRQESYV